MVFVYTVKYTHINHTYIYISKCIYINYMNLNKCKLCKGRRWTPVKPEQVGILHGIQTLVFQTNPFENPTDLVVSSVIFVSKKTSIMWTHVWVHFLTTKDHYVHRQVANCLFTPPPGASPASYCTHMCHIKTRINLFVFFISWNNVDVCTNIEVY